MIKRSSNITILLGFFLILTLLAMLIWLSLESIAENSAHIQKMGREQNEMRDIFAMRDSAQQRALMLYRMITTDDVFERDDLHMEFSNQAGIFIGARDQLLAKLDADERVLWDGVRLNIADGSRVQTETIELILQEKLDQAVEKVQSEVIPIQDNVMLGLTGMLDAQNKMISDGLEATTRQNRNAFLATLVMGGAALFAGVIAMFYVFRHSSKTESMLIEQQQVAQQANQAKSNFLSNMSHEIRTPLTAIIGFSQALESEKIEDNKRKRMLGSVIRNGKHLLELINDVLDISKIEANSFEVESIAVSPEKIISEVETLLLAKAANKNIEFEIKYNFPFPQYIKSDPTRLKQILINLCGNAIKFTEQGKITLEVNANMKSKQIFFCVRDQGIGMLPEVADKIFMPFVQADTSTTRKYGGTGLGLSISKDLSEKMKGSLRCRSELGVGSTFELMLPFGEDELPMFDSKDEFSENKTVIDEGAIYQLSGRVLLAEDNPDNQELISMFVRKTGADIEVVENGEDAVKVAMKHEYDLLLMDMQMPVIDGVEAVRNLRNSGYVKPIAMLTANVVENNRDICFEAGADDFLSKPIETSSFFRVLNKYLSKTKNDIVAENQKTLMESPDYKKIAQKFVAHLPGQLEKMEEAARNDDWESIERVSHSLKGMGSSFGYEKITQKSENINALCKLKQGDEMTRAIRDLVDYCATL